VSAAKPPYPAEAHLTTRRAAATPLPRTDYVRAGDRLRPTDKACVRLVGAAYPSDEGLLPFSIFWSFLPSIKVDKW